MSQLLAGVSQTETGEVRVDPVDFLKDAYLHILDNIFSYLRVPTLKIPYLPLSEVSSSWKLYVYSQLRDREKLSLAEYYFCQLKTARSEAKVSFEYAARGYCARCMSVLEWLVASQAHDLVAFSVSGETMELTHFFLSSGVMGSLCGTCKTGFRERIWRVFVFHFNRQLNQELRNKQLLFDRYSSSLLRLCSKK